MAGDYRNCSTVTQFCTLISVRSYGSDIRTPPRHRMCVYCPVLISLCGNVGGGLGARLDNVAPGSGSGSAGERVAIRDAVRRPRHIKPVVEESIELLARDFLGEGHEISGRGIAVSMASGPFAQEPEKGLIAQSLTQIVEQQRATGVDRL